MIETIRDYLALNPTVMITLKIICILLFYPFTISLIRLFVILGWQRKDEFPANLIIFKPSLFLPKIVDEKIKDKKQGNNNGDCQQYPKEPFNNISNSYDNKENGNYYGKPDNTADEKFH